MKLSMSAAWSAVLKAHGGAGVGLGSRLRAGASVVTAVAAVAATIWAATPALSAPPSRQSAGAVAKAAAPQPITMQLVSSGSNSLCVNPDGVIWGDGSSPPSTLATDFSNANGNCDPPTQLAGLNTAIAQSLPCDGGLFLAGSTWVGIDSGGMCSDAANSPGQAPGPYTNKYYIYDTEFTLPACASDLSIAGSMLADNAVATYLNQNLIGAQSNLNGGGSSNWTSRTPFSSSNLSYFELGTTNVLDFLVQDHSPAETALDFTATLTYTPCLGTLKICKVAGLGVSTGQSVKFTMTPAPASGASTVSVPAGPGPGGYCVVAGTFAQDTEVTVTESIPSGESVESIGVAPESDQLARSSSLSGGTVTVMVGTGVTETTYTDVSSRAEQNSGYLEICKQAVISKPWDNLAGSNPVFEFTVGGQVADGTHTQSQTVDLPGGTCSSPIQVLAGSVLVRETLGTTWNMVGCSFANGGDLTACNLADAYATVSVLAGSVSNEAILTITNSGYVPNTGTGGSSCTNCNVSFSAVIPAGDSNRDTGTVIGNAADGNPTGTMSFYECGPTAKPQSCTSKANPVGSLVSLVPGTDHTSTATSVRFWPSATGYWCFAESYSGDGNYPASSDTSTDGCFDVTSTALQVMTVTIPYAQAGQRYSTQLAATGGTAPYRWKATGLSKGLKLNAATGVLSGTPTVAGVYAPVVTVEDSAKPAHATSATFTLMVASGPVITSKSSTTFTLDSPRKFSVTTTGFPAPALTETGALPPGVTFIDNGNGTAILAGTAKADAGDSFPITITAGNTVGTNAVQNFTLNVAP
jgi:hypothetical protein